jgi:hypothetical protein
MDKKIIITIGRMNPPTPGHALLIKSMLEKAYLEGLTQINIILSDTVNNINNPFECEEKRELLYNYIIGYAKKSLIQDLQQKGKKLDETDEEKIRNIKVEVVCMNDEIKLADNKILNCIYYILSLYEYYIRNENVQNPAGLSVELVIGEDRKGAYEFIGNKLSGLNPPIHFQEIPLPRPEGAMSATKIRNAALFGNKSEFSSYYSEMGLSEEETNHIYDYIRENLNPPKPAKRSILSKRSSPTRKKTKNSKESRSSKDSKKTRNSNKSKDSNKSRNSNNSRNSKEPTKKGGKKRTNKKRRYIR